jgi:hypothetical protein
LIFEQFFRTKVSPVQDLVGDGGRGQEERGADADGQREGAHAEADLGFNVMIFFFDDFDKFSAKKICFS